MDAYYSSNPKAADHRITSAAPRIDRLPAGYQLTAADRQNVLQGAALFVAGMAIAKSQLLVKLMNQNEIAWYWVAAADNPCLITDLLLPIEQHVSYSNVKITPEAVARANFEARRAGCVIVGGGHSHHQMGAWTSGTDEELIDQLAIEGVGFSSQIPVVVDGVVHTQPAVAGRPLPALGTIEFRVELPDCPGVEALIIAPANVRREDLQVRFRSTRRRLLSLFSTSDTCGRYHFPMLSVTRCPWCGGREQEALVHPRVIGVVGRVALTDDERSQFLAEFQRRAPRRDTWYCGPKYLDPTATATTYASAATLDDWPDAPPAEPAGDCASDASPAPFSVYRRGVRVAVVEAAILERAAWAVPALAEALHWSDDRQGDRPEASLCLPSPHAAKDDSEPAAENHPPEGGDA